MQAKKRLPLSASEFVASYNATLTAKTGNADLDRATAGLQIHRAWEGGDGGLGGSVEVRMESPTSRKSASHGAPAAVSHREVKITTLRAENAEDTGWSSALDGSNCLREELCGLIFSWWNNSGRILMTTWGERRVRDLLIRKLLKIRIEEGWGAISAAEPGAAGIFAAMQQAEYCAEGAAGGDYDLYCGAILHADDYAAGNVDGAGGAQRRIGAGNL